jgi:hypothetical protein
MGVSMLRVWPPRHVPLPNRTWDSKLGATALRAPVLSFLSLMELNVSTLLKFVACSSAFAVSERLKLSRSLPFSVF